MNSLYAIVRDFLYREARYLDDGQWDQWLELYAADASFWMPCWDDNDTLTEDPQSEISLIWYGNRGGLEDRVFRIKTERSSATIPDTRTSHNLGNIEIVAEADGLCHVRFIHGGLSRTWVQDRPLILHPAPHCVQPRSD